MLTAQELKCLATLSPTSLEYDESRGYEDIFPIGEVRYINIYIYTSVYCISMIWAVFKTLLSPSIILVNE